jgi:hypothetical protein
VKGSTWRSAPFSHSTRMMILKRIISWVHLHQIGWSPKAVIWVVDWILFFKFDPIEPQEKAWWSSDPCAPPGAGAVDCMEPCLGHLGHYWADSWSYYPLSFFSFSSS